MLLIPVPLPVSGFAKGCEEVAGDAWRWTTGAPSVRTALPLLASPSCVSFWRLAAGLSSSAVGHKESQFLPCFWTRLQSPPFLGQPQVSTPPPARIAAKDLLFPVNFTAPLISFICLILFSMTRLFHPFEEPPKHCLLRKCR